MSDKQCPFYQGVCGIDESIVCYCSSASCDIYRDYVSEEKLRMTKERAIELLKIELACVKRNDDGLCDRVCAMCDLVQRTPELEDMYEYVIKHMEENCHDNC